jgi:hypothetical protein
MSDTHMTTEEIADALGVSLPPAPKQTVAEQLAAIETLTVSDCLKFFYDRATDRQKQIGSLAEEKYAREGEVEFDGAIVGESDNDGAYVLTWVHVDQDTIDSVCGDKE